VKRTGRGESIGVVIHICITTQGNSLCGHLYSFFFNKIEEQEDFSGVREGGLAPEKGGGGGERGKRMNMVQTMCTHVC
jgi:hypothetical protein